MCCSRSTGSSAVWPPPIARSQWPEGGSRSTGHRERCCGGRWTTTLRSRPRGRGSSSSPDSLRLPRGSRRRDECCVTAGSNQASHRHRLRTAPARRSTVRWRSTFVTSGSSWTTAPPRATCCAASSCRSPAGSGWHSWDEPVRGKVSVPGACALCPQSPGDLLVRERVGDELPGEIGGRALAAAGLQWAAAADPRDLSGGERQRLALAIVMAGRAGDDAVPGLVCLDEPTRGLDRARKEELAAWAAELAKAGAAVVIATHDVEFAASFADRVVLLGDGEVIADGPVADVLSGGWFFATEVARSLGAGGAILPELGAELLRERLTPRGEAVTEAR